MSKIKLFTHTDLDGVGCAVLADFVFGRENVDVEYCGYDDVNGRIREFYLCNDESYDAVYITDISVDEKVALEIDSLVEARQNWYLFDHHATALGLNKYSWCDVRVEDPVSELKTCGAKLFFSHLINTGYLLTLKNNQFKNLMRFVDIVWDYDTWRWKELGEEGIICKQVNDLFYIYGRDEFIDWAIEQITGEFIPIRPLSKFPSFTEKDIALLTQKQKDIDIYVAEKEKQLRVATDQFGKTFGWVFAERYFSELGNRLCELHPEIEYVAMIDISRGVVSFRSVKDDVDLCNGIAHSLGGGGHKKAAGSTFDAVEVGKFVSWNVLNVKPAWSDIMPQYMGEPIKKED